MSVTKADARTYACAAADAARRVLTATEDLISREGDVPTQVTEIGRLADVVKALATSAGDAEAA